MLAGPAMSQTTPTPDPVLAGYRASIDNIDAALIHILAERFRITKQYYGGGFARSRVPGEAVDQGRQHAQQAGQAEQKQTQKSG